MADPSGFAAALAGSMTGVYPPRTLSPAQREKDEAIMIARRVLKNNSGATREEALLLSRQLLGALALSP